jgi:signal transduction histidine kinase
MNKDFFKMLQVKFNNINEKVDFKNEKNFKILTTTAILASVAYFFFDILYFILKAKYLVYYQTCGILLFLFMLYILIKYPNSSKCYYFVQHVAFFDVITRPFVNVFFLGLSSGLQYFMLCTLSFPFFLPNRKRIYRFFLYAISTIAYIAVQIIYKKAVPFYAINIKILDLVKYLCIASTFSIIVLTSYFYIEAVKKAEDIILKKNESIANALNNLKETEKQLIMSEKMAALGQLISGIAHEINNPLGAIKASIDNITEYMQNTLEEKLPQIFKILNEDELILFFQLLKKSMENQLIISSKEKRAYKKSIASLLDEVGIENSSSIADEFADMGIYEVIEQYYPLLKNKNSTFIIQTCYEISGIIRNSRNISISVERASKIIFALKCYSYMDNCGQQIESDIIEGIETVLALYNHNIKQGIEVVRNYTEIPKIKCYPDELNQVWTNIISNALQAMEYNGVIEINVFEDKKEVVVSIVNSGPGIPEEIRKVIFEPFFTTKHQGEGTGLGLDIVKKIVIKHNGTIDVESISGKTAFIVRIPIQ